ncbi:MAG: cytochrome bc1 complex cytochrome b subunit, partial [Micromonosporaceae bacterium]
MKRRRFDPKQVPAEAAGAFDDRFQLAKGLRAGLVNKIFPDHWSFLLGEIALFSFILLLLSGTFLALFYDPSMEEVIYNGAYTPLRGVPMSKAFASSLDLSFEVRGGLIMRQMHHWGALLFMAAIFVHMFRIFFTGAFRKPRETNWLLGIVLLNLGFFEGFIGYSLPDDALSGTGLRIASGIVLSIPLVGTWAQWALFGGEFPGTVIIPRFYILHVFLLPVLLLALIVVHIGLVFKQKHTQWPGPARTERNVVGYHFIPDYISKQASFSMIVFGIIALMSGLFQINPIWLFGPYKGEVVSSGSQPDWYVMFMDGMIRLYPPWEISAFGYTVPAVFFPAVLALGLAITLVALYPFLE